MEKPPAFIKRIVTTLCMILFIVAVFFFAGKSAYYIRHSLQMDFSAFYTAGQALNAGLSPYENHIAKEPPIWDGINVYKHSRFLYPPLIAGFFRSFAILPYPAAKTLWTILTVVFIFTSLFLLLRKLRFPLSAAPAFALGAFVLFFSPLQAHIERGQIDGLTLLLILCAVIFQDKQKGLPSGLFLAAATFFKLHCLLILPFWLLRKKYSITASYLLFLVFLCGASVVVEGYAVNRDYLENQLPRISQYGERGPAAWRVDADIIAIRIAKAPGGTVKDGQPYLLINNFVYNASPVKSLHQTLAEKGINLRPTLISTALLTLFLAGLFIALRFTNMLGVEFSAFQEVLYWQIVLTMLLLCAPLTWIMNMVWMLPGALILLYRLKKFPGEEKAALVIILAGLLLALLPDGRTLGFEPILWNKNIIAESIFLGGCLLLFLRSLKVKNQTQKAETGSAG